MSDPLQFHNHRQDQQQQQQQQQLQLPPPSVPPQPTPTSNDSHAIDVDHSSTSNHQQHQESNHNHLLPHQHHHHHQQQQQQEQQNHQTKRLRRRPSEIERELDAVSKEQDEIQKRQHRLKKRQSELVEELDRSRARETKERLKSDHAHGSHLAALRLAKLYTERVVYGTKYREEFGKVDGLGTGHPKFSGRWWGHSVKIELRRLLAEVHGTFLLVFCHAGAVAADAYTGGHVINHTAKGLSAGLILVALIYQIGQISGAHFNPAVTFAFALHGVFPWWRVPFYWIAQLGGSLLAGLFLYILFGHAGFVGSNIPCCGEVRAFTWEIVLTYMLVTTILGTAERSKVLGPHAALAVGAMLSVLVLFGGEASAASMNPFRALGPALVSGGYALDVVWAYFAGPFVGATGAVIIERFLASMRGHRDPRDAAKAALGFGHA